MKRRILTLVFASAFAAVPTLHAQFNFGELKKNLNLPAGIPGGDKLNSKNLESGGKLLKGAGGITPQEELAIGESVALEIVGKFGGIVRDEDITKRVNLIGRALAYYSTRPALDWKFGVLDSPSINGFSAPGGIVFITRGLYDLTGDNDNALAAVLAHEIAHITGRHALTIIERAQATEGAKDLYVDNNAQAAKVNSQLNSKLQLFDFSVDKGVKLILQQGFDAPTEYAADKEARALALTVGYAPGALRQVLIKLQQRTGTTTAIFSTHPPLASRIQRLPAE